MLSEKAKSALRSEIPSMVQALDRIIGKLDETHHECASCGLKVMHVVREGQVGVMLRAMRQRLRNFDREARRP